MSDFMPGIIPEESFLYAKSKKIVLFGGTFDPIHNDHLSLAHELVKLFNSKISFMPTGKQRYKSMPQANAQQRLDMLKLALDNNPNFQIDTQEIDSLDYCYSQKTFLKLREQVGYETPIYFVIGGDSLISLDSWDYWLDLINLTNFIVVWRKGYAQEEAMSEPLAKLFNEHKTTDFSNLTNPHSNIPYGKFYLLNLTLEDISSTLIRQRVKNHQDISALTPKPVVEYISKHGLYLTI